MFFSLSPFLSVSHGVNKSFIYKKKKIGGDGLGAKRLGLGDETTRGPKRGRNDQGGNVLGAKRLVTLTRTSIYT